MGFSKGSIVVALGSGLLYAVFGGPGIILGLGIGLVAMIVSLTSAISSGLDYNGVKTSIGTSLIAGLGGAIGFLVTKTPQGAFIGFSLATALQLNLNSISAHMAQQIIAAIEENGGDVYLDGDKVGKQVTAYQNRQNRMYGKTLQRI